MKKIIVLDIGGTTIKYGIVTEKGELLQCFKTPTEAEKGGTILLERIVLLIEQLLDHDINGIAISTAGQVNVKSGEVIYVIDNILGWAGMKLKSTIQEKYLLSVYVAKEVNSYLMLTIGTGIGGVIVINNQFYGSNCGIAGEFGQCQNNAGLLGAAYGFFNID